MTTTKKIIWRLTEKPSTEALRELVKDGILTKEEAREILFSYDSQEDRDQESYKAEVTFLRRLVEKLSENSRTQIVETIKEVYIPYAKQPWYRPYEIWCSTNTELLGLNADSNLTNGGQAAAFTSINTF